MTSQAHQNKCCREASEENMININHSIISNEHHTERNNHIGKSIFNHLSDLLFIYTVTRQKEGTDV